jgi:hypothetical protein
VLALHGPETPGGPTEPHHGTGSAATT